ncbi:MAG: ferredoxin [Vagococcus sp.]|uniref:ferredoxin n=1 Tax=Vagococcus sp. TaxID=1933889 RepID=UPI002FC86F48
MLYKIIPNKCIACGLCQLKAPKTFDYHDNGIVKFLDSDNETLDISNDLPTELLNAYRVCPTRAIVIEK